MKLDPTILEQNPDLPEANARAYDDLFVRHWDQWEDGTYSHLFVMAARPVGGGGIVAAVDQAKRAKAQAAAAEQVNGTEVENGSLAKK